MSKHVILFLAANPLGTTELALGREARAIQEELERSGQRDRFEFVTRWAVQPLDLIRELRKLKPTVVHFSGHGGSGRQQGTEPGGNIVVEIDGDGGANDIFGRGGLFFQGHDGRPQLVTAAALRETFGAAGASVKLVVLNACYSDIHAEALLVHIDCVVGMSFALRDDAAKAFSIGFYGGLGERQSVTAAYLQACAAISMEEPQDGKRPQLKVRDGVDADQVILAEVNTVERGAHGAPGLIRSSSTESVAFQSSSSSASAVPESRPSARPAPTRPVPAYPNAEVEQLSKRLEDARARRDKLRGAGIAADHVDREILDLRRQLREGGRLRAGDALGDGRYLLVKVVGRGGFSVVWEAYDCTAQNRVAIKVLHSSLAGDPLRRERFFRGAQAMMRLTHPAVVRVLAPKGEDGGFYYFVMEFIPGGNLREAVLERRLKNEDMLPLILRIGEALALAHARRMIHRDVKPTNILLDEHGNAKLTDFDLVGAPDTTGGTRTGVLGTVVYAAPECLEKPQEATARADVYGLGMTAIFCLSGQDLSMDTFRNPEGTISKLDCLVQVQNVLRRAVAWEPDKRFADAAGMLVELRDASNPTDWEEPAFQFLDVTRPREDLLGIVPALTIVSHPFSHRVGERCLLDAVASGREVNLSRNAPTFTRPSGALGVPLDDPFVSQRPIRFVPGAGGGVRVIVDAGGTPVIAGAPVDGSAEFTADDLAHGVALELAERLVLLLHQVDRVEDAADPLGMIGASTGIRRVRAAIEQVVDLAVPVLIRGETGTGKELVARAIHDKSPRRDGPFVSVNLGAIPREIAAAELFGSTRRAWAYTTGSRGSRDRDGLFHTAHSGTLFLDDVGEAPSEVQVMLLRVLETGEFYPVGAERPVAIQVRLIAATDANLEEQIQHGQFKAPLLHRLAGFEVRIPPLRERREDIGLLFYHFAREEMEALGEGHRLSPKDPYARPWLPTHVAAQLVRYAWPGNVRELRNVTRQLVIESRGLPQVRLDPRLADQLDVMARPSAPTPPGSPDPAIEVRRKASDVTEAELQDALRTCAWDLKAAADRLRIPRPSIYDLIERSPHIRTADDLGDDDRPRRTAAASRGDPLILPGELLGDRFEIEQSIGSGGMGTVFRAHDPISGETVAIKVISDERSHLAGRFAREIKVLAELSHPGIVRYISHGVTSSGQRFLAMEWVNGEVLKTRLERGPLPLSEAVTLATRVAEALGAAHAHGIVHRDLKPSNLIFPSGRIDQVKILDFGLAQRKGHTQLTQTGMIIGTPGYMAPEQARASGQIDARADVFALGCVLFQCLTGVPPFNGDTTAAILAKILFDAAPRVSELWPEVPESLDVLVAQMLSKDPALRPSDGVNLAAALAALGPLVQTAPMAPRERAASPRAAISGERRLLTVVMLSPPPQDDALLEEPLRHAVAPYRGRLEQLADGSVVVMLDPDHHVATDHAARAARCALAMCAIATDRPLAIAMGRTESGSRLPKDDVIDRASRLLAQITRRPGELPPIALDEVSAGLLDARFDVIEHESQLRLRGERAVMQGTRTLLGRPTSCVGRDWELGALAGIVAECIEESAARVAVVTAAAGMGKSRLGAEFVSRARQRYPEVAVWVGRGDSLRAGSTLDLLAQALRGALGLHDGELLSTRHDKLRARVAEHVPSADRDRVTVFLGELVGAPFPDDGKGDAGAANVALRAARQDAQLMSELMRRAWLDFLQAETSAQPVLLVLEDLHWGDFGTVRFVDAALRDRGKQPWMVLALARPEVFEVFPKLWAERQNVQALRLKELGRKAGERLVCQVLGDTVDSDTVDRLIKQADGNAFYLEELIRAVAEGKDRSTPLPGTVLAMVETRLGRLPPEARRVLRAASVFGEVCWESSVVTLLGDAMGATMVGEWLAILVEQEVLVARPDSRFPDERELAFRHALLREGAYAMLTADDEVLAHRLAGEWLERHGETEPMVLAGHARRGGDTARAAGFYLRAAEQAVHVLDNEGAIARASLGLECDPPPELRFALLGIRCHVSHRLQRHSIVDAEELMRSAPRGSVPWTQGMISYLLTTMMAGRDEELQAQLTVLAEITPVPGAVGWMSLLFLGGAFLLDLLGRVAQATALEEPFLALASQRGDQAPLARFWWNASVGLRASHAHEDPWNALVHSDAIQPISDLIGGDILFLTMQLLRGMNLWYLGAHARAVELLESSSAADTTLGEVSPLRRIVLSWLGADRGALDDARALAIEVREFCRAHHDRLGEARGTWALAEVLRRLVDLEAADREIQAALAMAMPLDRPGVLATLSLVRLAQGRAGEALAAAEDAMAHCEAMGGCGMFRGAFVRLAHAEALHATGAHDAARRAIAHARARLFAIANTIPDPGYKASFLEGVPENARTLTLAHAWLGDAAPNP